MSSNVEWSMNNVHQKVLIRKRLELARNLCLEELLQYLVQENIVTDRMVEKVLYQPTAFSRNVAFLSILPKRGPTAYQTFKMALRETLQSHLADMLSEAEVQMQGVRSVMHHVSLKSTFNSPDNETGQILRSDIGFDLQDGQSNLYVQNTTVDFFKATRQFAYKMTSKPRGFALLINIAVFDEGRNLEKREGSQMDQNNLSKLLRQLHFEVTLLENCSAFEMTNKLQSFARNPKHAQVDCCIVAILSHGTQNSVYGKDGEKVDLTQIFQMFDNVRCPLLQNKPKIFLIQACRDISEDVSDGPPVSTDNGSTESFQNIGKSLDNGGGSRLPTLSDMIIGHASLPGCSAVRNTRHGSWYIQAFVKLMANHAKDKELTEILTLVNNFVRNKIPSSEEKLGLSGGMPDFVSTLCKKLYLYPGVVDKCHKGD